MFASPLLMNLRFSNVAKRTAETARGTSLLAFRAVRGAVSVFPEKLLKITVDIAIKKSHVYGMFRFAYSGLVDLMQLY